MEMNPSILFISGGVRSGKSTFAEELAREYAIEEEANLHYIATSVVTDAEMKERIFLHQKGREKQVLKWTTWEKPVHLGELTCEFQKSDILLLDCLTTLVGNELFLYEEEQDIEKFRMKIQKKLENELLQLSQVCKYLIIVSNEVTYEPIENPYVLTYCKILNYLHCFLVKYAKFAYLVENGIALKKKGE